MTAIETTMPDLKISPSIQQFMDDLRVEESTALEKSIVEQGVRDNLIVWDETGTIIDGHNRWKICQKHSIVPPFQRVSFKDEDAVKNWIIENQLARRNLTPQRFDYYVGELYNRTKGAVDGAGDTSEKIAKKTGISPKSVRRAGNFAEGVDALERVVGKLAKADVLAGKSKLTKEDLRKAGRAPNPVVAKKTIEKVVAAADKRETAKKTVKATGKAKTKYEVVVAMPTLDTKSLVDLKTMRPATDENSCLFMLVEDYNLDPGIQLLKGWGFNYEASYIIIEEGRQDVSNWSKLKHKQLLIGTKGIVGGPLSGKEPDSTVRSANALDTVFNVIGKFPFVNDAKNKLVLNAGTRVGWTAS